MTDQQIRNLLVDALTNFDSSVHWSRFPNSPEHVAADANRAKSFAALKTALNKSASQLCMTPSEEVLEMMLQCANR